MKKVIFSAVAMIAFVGSSMASDIAEKEVVVENSQNISVEKSESAKLIRENCDLVKFRTYNLALELGYSHDKASDYSYMKFFQCVWGNVKNIE
jgi:hypothetical protein